MDVYIRRVLLVYFSDDLCFQLNDGVDRVVCNLCILSPWGKRIVEEVAVAVR